MEFGHEMVGHSLTFILASLPALLCLFIYRDKNRLCHERISLPWVSTMTDENCDPKYYLITQKSLEKDKGALAG